MKLFRNGVLAFVFVFLTINCIFSQVGADLNDEFYEDAVQWEISGKIQKLPMLRPYPLSLIKDILLKVMQSDDVFAAEKAAYYFRQFFDDGIVRIGAEANGTIATGDYGENNKYVMKMWENFKSDALPTWATTLFIIIIVSGLGLIAYFVVNSVLKKQLKKKRKENK